MHQLYANESGRQKSAKLRQLEELKQRHMSETSADIREQSLTDLESRLEREMQDPIKKFNGLNRIRMCGRTSRCFMGEKPKALLFTGSMINVPATFFNIFVAPVSLFGDTNRYIILAIGVFLQMTSNALMLWTSVIDPGIIPATFYSKDAKFAVDKRYLNIKHKN